MIPAIGAMNTAYADMKFKNVLALERMIHGTMAQPPITAAKRTPRLMLKYLGHSDVMSSTKRKLLAARKDSGTKEVSFKENTYHCQKIQH